jgi:GalNAc-alpha-(1->4)-GalNAc-alpha-(1->3)-diNAcBac-PP-undecaprenol alpha-1,4-N-acetyl-D-galactosaminyltransferase
MKITFICSSLECGGAEKVLLFLLNKFNCLGFKTEVISLFDNNGNDFYNIPLETNYIKLNLSSINYSSFRKYKNLLNGILNLRSHLKQNRADIIISFLSWVNIITLIATINLGIPVVIREQSDPKNDNSNLFFNFIRKSLYIFASKIILLSPRFIEYFPQSIQKKCVVIPNLIILKSKQIEKINKREKIIVSIGRLSDEKDHQLLIKAFHKIHKQIQDWKLEIYGEGVLKTQLSNLIKQLKLDQQVILKGLTYSPKQVLQTASFSALTSKYEGFPNVILESLSVKTPVLSFGNIGAVPDIISNELNGLLINRETDQNLLVKNLSDAILRLVNDYTLLDKLSSNSLESISKFDSDLIFDVWYKLVTELVKK